MASPDDPPRPPPHGQAPRTPGGSKLPDGNYDIFIIPPSSAGSGFLYLPSLQPHRNSFLAGVACTLLAVGVYTLVIPVVKHWMATVSTGGGGIGVAVLVIAVGVAAWAFGKTQGESSAGSRFDFRTGGGSGANGSHQQQYSGPPPSWQTPPPPPPPNSNNPPPGEESQRPPPAPPPQHEPQPEPQPQPQPQPRPKASPHPSAAQTGWEKAREETKKREEARKREEDLRKKREEAQRMRDEAEKAAKAKAEKEKWEQARAREKEQREREARERVQRERLQREKEQREKDQKEREARERAEKEKAEWEKKRQAEKAKAEKDKADRIRAAAAASVRSSPTKAARSQAGTETGHSYRPYDTPKRNVYTSSASSISGLSESSYAPSQSTARTTPPPSHRGPYSTDDPDKIQIRAVYLFSDNFPTKPTSQLLANQAPVTDGLILHIKTEGLFIDDDIRGVPQREWDVKAWTLKLVEDGMAKTAAGTGLHVLRATARDTQNSKYTFVLDESEAWKVAVGLQRLRKGSQVRSLGMNGMKESEVKGLLAALGWM